MNERKTIFLAVGILLVAMIASSFNNSTNSTFSGYGIQSDSGTRIDINPNPVGRNQIIEVTVYPGSGGVYNQWMWIERDGSRMQTTQKQICPVQGTKEAVCYGVSKVQYLVGTDETSWPSDAVYTIRVKEHVDSRLAGIKQDVYAKEDFRII